MSALSPVLLVIDDDPQLRKFLRRGLAREAYQVIEATSGADGVSAAARYSPDLILLEPSLPDLHGVALVRRLRQASSAPIVVLSSQHEEADKIVALDAGADDYLGKPFWIGELMARIRVALRHSARKARSPSEPVLAVGELRLDLSRRAVLVADRQVHLTPNEYNLLVALMKHAGTVLTHRQLLEEAWGTEQADNTPQLRVYVGKLRRKLEADASRPRYLTTESGVGYRLRLQSNL